MERDIHQYFHKNIITIKKKKIGIKIKKENIYFLNLLRLNFTLSLAWREIKVSEHISKNVIFDMNL